MQNSPFRVLLRWFRHHGYHLIFGLCLISMAALCAWWGIFIRRAIAAERQSAEDGLRFHVWAYASLLGQQSTAPAAGLLELDNRFEVVPLEGAVGRDLQVLAPNWEGLGIRARPQYLRTIEARYHRRMFMLFGEGTLLAILVLAAATMLYRMVWLERRTAKELREFWGRVTHEIKTPITGLKAFLQTLKTQQMPRRELDPLLDLALEQIERQQQLAQNVLIGHRLDRDPSRARLDEVSLGEFLRRLLASHALLLARRRVHLGIGEGRGPTVFGDPDSLHVIVDNLIDNALKYGGDDLVLDVSIEASDRSATVHFQDNGPGFDPALAENIFEAYRRLTGELPAGRHGTGLGLYISRQLARRMGGDLVASSQGPGKGARFSLRIPTLAGARRA